MNALHVFLVSLFSIFLYILASNLFLKKKTNTQPQAKWILKDDKGNGVCSNCHRQDAIDPLATHCRYCGAPFGFDE